MVDQLTIMKNSKEKRVVESRYERVLRCMTELKGPTED